MGKRNRKQKLRSVSVRTLSEQRRAEILESARVPALIAQLSVRRPVYGPEMEDG